MVFHVDLLEMKRLRFSIPFQHLCHQLMRNYLYIAMKNSWVSKLTHFRLVWEPFTILNPTNWHVQWGADFPKYESAFMHSLNKKQLKLYQNIFYSRLKFICSTFLLLKSSDSIPQTFTLLRVQSCPICYISDMLAASLLMTMLITGLRALLAEPAVNHSPLWVLWCCFLTEYS